MTYLKINDSLYSPEAIIKIDCKAIEQLIIQVHTVSDGIIQVEGLDAINVVLQANPSMIEGKRFKFKKHMWIIHNLLAHPIMQILAIFGFYKLAFWVHDVTVPKPIKGKHNEE